MRDVTAESFRERTGIEAPTVISGGFPCQPHSLAGERKASDDERDLWPEFRRVIGEIKPRWVVGENVRGLLSSEDGRFFRGILRDFADMGFNAGWCAYRAADIGAVHARERVAIIAYSGGVRLQRRSQGGAAEFFEKLSIPILQRASENDISETGICGSDVRIPARMDRLRSVGNAVVPAQFYPIFEAITRMED